MRRNHKPMKASEAISKYRPKEIWVSHLLMTKATGFLSVRNKGCGRPRDTCLHWSGALWGFRRTLLLWLTMA